MKRIFTLLLLLLLLDVYMQAQCPTGSEILGQWTFEGEVNTASTTANGITADPATFSGVGTTDYFNGNGGGDAYSANGWSETSDLTSSITFCISGPIESITSISFDERRSSTGPGNIRVDGESTIGANTVTETLVDETIPDNSSWRSRSYTPITTSGFSETFCFVVYGYNAEGGTGAWRFDDVTICGELQTPQPVTLTSFTAQSVGNSVALSWTTASEDGNDYFAVEHSRNGKEFKEIGQVSGAGWSILEQEYSYVQEYAPAGTHYYRLRQVDFDGDYEYSPVRSIEVTSNGSAFLVYPTNANGEITVEIPETNGSEAILQIFNSSGQIIYSKPIRNKGTITINVNEYEPGAYFIRFTNGNSSSTGRFFVL